MRLLHRILLLISVLSTLIYLPLWGQDAAGKITGVVTDPSGAVVSDAKVTVTNTTTNVGHDTTTNQSGFYQALQLPIGSYRVSVEAAGFQKTTIASNTPLNINQTLKIDVELQVGQTSNTVTVESNVSQVETENSTAGGTVIGQAIFELPLNGRNTLDLLATQPGVTPTNPNSGAAGGYSIGGMRTDSVTYLLDGGLNNNLLSNNVVANPNPDAVAEFRVIENNYGAEYGRNAGGIVSVVTKSGSNQLHFTAYDYVRNNFFDANSFFNNQQGLATPVLKRNQYGGTVGGPILKDKLFFFFSYQGQKQTSLDLSLGQVNTFTPAESNGNFSRTAYASQVATFLGQNPQYQPNPTLAQQGIIDPTRIDPVARNYFAKGLIPTSPLGYLFPQASSTNNSEEYLGRIDYNLTTRDVITGTFTASDNPRLVPFGSLTSNVSSVIGFPITNSDTNYFGNLAYTHTFTPNLLNELRITAQRQNHKQAYPASSAPNASQLGANVPSDDPVGPPRVAFQGSDLNIGFSPQGPTNEIDNTYAYYDNLSWVKGNHSLKFGFFFSPYQNNTVYDFYVTGEYIFYGPGTGVGSGVDFADFLLGLPDEFQQFGKAPSNIRSHQYAGFAQDTWKVTKNFTLNFGLRYEYAQPKYDTQGRSFSFIPGLQSQRFVNAPRGLVFPGDPGAPTGANFPDKNDFGPRFGFAWAPSQSGKTSIRGGGGMFYDILKAEDNLQFNGQAPFFGFGDVSPNKPSTLAGPSGLQDPYAAAGAVNPFPSKPPSKNLDFNAAGYLPFGGSGVYFVNPQLRTPYVFQYNLSLQQQLAANLLLEVGYLGYSAHKMTGLVDVNPFPLGSTRRLYGSDFSYLDQFQNVGKANYNAMQVHLKRIFSKMGALGGGFFDLSYTWSHEIDNQSGFRESTSRVPYYNHNQFRASGDTDLRHVLNISGGWDLPFDQLWGHGPKILTKGWSLYPIFSYSTGFPLSVSAGLSRSNSNPGPSGAGDASLVRADYNGSPIGTLDPSVYQYLPNSTGSLNGGNYWFNPAVFSNTRLSTANSNKTPLTAFPYGTFPRNALRGPGRTNLDLTISKHFFLTERMNVELRGDAFNVLNHTEFQNPNTTVSSPLFGQISTTYDPRILQLALHLQF